MKKIIACISIICYTLLCYSQNQTTDNNYRTQKNISYLHPGEKDSYKLERCKLDLHYPTDKKGFATLIWFHGDSARVPKTLPTRKMPQRPLLGLSRI